MCCGSVNLSCQMPNLEQWWENVKPDLIRAAETAKSVLINAAEITKSVLISTAKVAGLITAFLYSPYVFAVGAFLGALFHNELAGRIDAPIELWNKSLINKVVMVAIGALTWPITAQLLTIWMASRWVVQELL